LPPGMTHVTNDREHFAAETLWEGMVSTSNMIMSSPSRGSSVRFDDQESESKSMGCLIHVRLSSSRLRVGVRGYSRTWTPHSSKTGRTKASNTRSKMARSLSSGKLLSLPCVRRPYRSPLQFQCEAGSERIADQESKGNLVELRAVALIEFRPGNRQAHRDLVRGEAERSHQRLARLPPLQVR
jgi:hypothetical protein